MKTDIREDRKRQVETTRLRYGASHYSDIAKKAKKDPKQQQLKAYRRWHPEWFNEEGELKDEHKEKVK